MHFHWDYQISLIVIIISMNHAFPSPLAMVIQETSKNYISAFSGQAKIRIKFAFQKRIFTHAYDLRHFYKGELTG